jgi:hypothetical protein
MDNWKSGVRALVVGAAVTMGVGVYAQGPGQPWTSIGAAGSVDEADAGKVVVYDTGSIALASSSRSATAVVRYNVVATPGLVPAALNDPDEPTLDLRASIRDTGQTARVVVRLQQMDRASGAITTIAAIDSDTFESEASDAYVERGCLVRIQGVSQTRLDCSRNVYFVDVRLMKTAASGNPGVKFVSIEKSE